MTLCEFKNTFIGLEEDLNSLLRTIKNSLFISEVTDCKEQEEYDDNYEGFFSRMQDKMDDDVDLATAIMNFFIYNSSIPKCSEDESETYSPSDFWIHGVALRLGQIHNALVSTLDYLVKAPFEEITGLSVTPDSSFEEKCMVIIECLKDFVTKAIAIKEFLLDSSSCANVKGR